MIRSKDHKSSRAALASRLSPACDEVSVLGGGFVESDSAVLRTPASLRGSCSLVFSSALSKK